MPYFLSFSWKILAFIRSFNKMSTGGSSGCFGALLGYYRLLPLALARRSSSSSASFLDFQNSSCAKAFSKAASYSSYLLEAMLLRTYSVI